MAEDRLITVAIHTYDKAVALKNLLDHEGVESVLHNVNLTNPVVSSGVRVRIKENDLPLALRIIENYEIFIDNKPVDADSQKTILVPVDFSDYSLRATKIAFEMAKKHKSRILLLHSFINPALSKRIQLTDALSFELAETQDIEKKLRKAARRQMDEFETKIKQFIKSGEIPPVKFTSEITEGVPEEVINESAKSIQPMLIVMGTRGADRKEEELIGSVTAELLDSCRFPVFTIPESVNLTKVEKISNIVFFCNLEQEDILALDAIYRSFPEMLMNVTIVHIPGKKERTEANHESMKTLLNYCQNHYPHFTFTAEHIRLDHALEDYKKITGNHDANLIALPNKQRNVFVRFFNPSLAHRLLLHVDIPMIVVPV